MTSKKILEVVFLYQEELKKLQDNLREVPHAMEVPDSVLSHCLYMLGQIKIFVVSTKIEKAFRWLGFIQGVLWSHGVYSINEMRNHNRDDRKKYEEKVPAFSTEEDIGTTLEQLLEEKDGIPIVVDEYSDVSE